MVNLYTAQVERDDLLMFFNACLSATSQAEFYTEGFEQRLSLDFVHSYMRVNYRQLYALMLAQEINDHNRQRIVFQLLAFPAGAEQHPLENQLIAQSLQRLPVHRVYKLFAQLVSQRVNNRRARSSMRQYLEQRNNLVFDALKYRPLLRLILRHLHWPLDQELFVFLFIKGWKMRHFQTPLLELYRQAHFSEKAIYQLPYTVAEGLAARLQVPRERFLAGIAPQMTAQERLRLQRNAAEHRLKLEWDPARHELLQLMLYALSHQGGDSAHPQDWQALLEAYFAQRPPQPLPGRVAAVLDNSFSSWGSRERLRRPLGLALGLHHYLQRAATDYLPCWLSEPAGPFAVAARGPTDLAHPLIRALQWQPDLLLIVSDGYENTPAWGVDWVLRQIHTHKLAKLPEIYHLNPVWNPLTFAPQALSPLLLTLGIREVENLPKVLAFGRFLTQRLGQADLLQIWAQAQQLRVGSAGPALEKAEATQGLAGEQR